MVVNIKVKILCSVMLLILCGSLCKQASSYHCINSYVFPKGTFTPPTFQKIITFLLVDLQCLFSQTSDWFLECSALFDNYLAVFEGWDRFKVLLFLHHLNSNVLNYWPFFISHTRNLRAGARPSNARPEPKHPDSSALAGSILRYLSLKEGGICINRDVEGFLLRFHLQYVLSLPHCWLPSNSLHEILWLL